VHDGHSGDGAEANAERVRLRRDHVSMFVGVADDGGDALVSGYRLFVVAFPPFERLGEVCGGLVQFALEVQFVDAALGDHYFYRPDQYGLHSRDEVDFLRCRCAAHLRVHEDLVRLPEAKRGGIHGHELPICF